MDSIWYLFCRMYELHCTYPTGRTRDLVDTNARVTSGTTTVQHFPPLLSTAPAGSTMRSCILLSTLRFGAEQIGSSRAPPRKLRLPLRCLPFRNFEKRSPQLPCSGTVALTNSGALRLPYTGLLTVRNDNLAVGDVQEETPFFAVTRRSMHVCIIVY